MSVYALGDIHNRATALKEVLAKSKFDYENDKLIILGDVCDGFEPSTYEVVEELLKIKNRIFVLGNHDDWLINYIRYGATPWVWTGQGGDMTLLSYEKHGGIPQTHKDFFLKEPIPYYEENNQLFVHGGIGLSNSPRFCGLECFTWDRTMWERVQKGEVIGHYEDIFIGHTSTEGQGAKPLHYSNVWNLDAGAGFRGRLSCMNIKTKEYWLSKFQKAELF